MSGRVVVQAHSRTQYEQAKHLLEEAHVSIWLELPSRLALSADQPPADTQHTLERNGVEVRLEEQYEPDSEPEAEAG